jgi:hypothetical protein
MKRDDYAVSILGLVLVVGPAILFTSVSADTGSGKAGSMMGGPGMGMTGVSRMMGGQPAMGMMGG